MAAVIVSARAKRDIDDVFAWLRANAPESIDRWYARLLAALKSLEFQPDRCSLASAAEILGLELREHNFGKRRGMYRILFNAMMTSSPFCTFAARVAAQ